MIKREFFENVIGGFFILLLVYISGVHLIYSSHFIVSSVVILAYFIFGQIYIQKVVDALWLYIGEKRVPQKLTATLGVIEQLIYAICLILNAWTFIGVWFGLKIAQRLLKYTRDSGNDMPPKEYDAIIRKDGERRNAYFIGNVVSLALGLSVGLLVRILLIRLQIINLNDKFPFFI